MNNQNYKQFKCVLIQDESHVLQLIIARAATNSLIIRIVSYLVILCYVCLGPKIGKGVYKLCFVYKLINSSIREIFHIFSLSFFSLCQHSFLSFISLYGIRARAFINGVEYSSYIDWFIFHFSTRADSNGRSTKPILLASW